MSAPTPQSARNSAEPEEGRIEREVSAPGSPKDGPAPLKSLVDDPFEEIALNVVIDGKNQEIKWSTEDEFLETADVDAMAVLEVLRTIQQRAEQAATAEQAAKGTIVTLQAKIAQQEAQEAEVQTTMAQLIQAIDQLKVENDGLKQKLAEVPKESDTMRLLRLSREALGLAPPVASVINKSIAPSVSALSLQTSSGALSTLPDGMPIKEINSRVPEPYVFKGNRQDFTTWFLRLENRLKYVPHLYPTEDHKLHYILSRTEGKGSMPITARMKKNSLNPYRTAEEMLKDLNTSFGDVDAAQRAQRMLADKAFPMQQNEDIEEYYTRFINTVNEIPLYASGHAEEAKTELFRNNLAPEIRSAIAIMGNDAGFNAVRQAAFTTYHNQRPQSSASKRKAGEKGEGDRPKKAKTFSPNTTRSADLKKSCMDERRCLKCGEQGHRSRYCPAAAWATNDEVQAKIAGRPAGNANPPN